MADTPFLKLSKSLFQVVQTWLHHCGAAIEAALACPVLESQKAEFTELLMAEGAEKPKARPSDVSHVPLPATQQLWRPFHNTTQKRVFLSPTAGVELSNADHFQYLRKTHKDLREWLIFADSELHRNSDKVHTTLAAQVSKQDTLQWHLELYQVTVNLLKERNTDLQERAEKSEALAAVQREELQDLRCQLGELESLSTGAPMPDILYPGNTVLQSESLSDLFHK
ncbi:hypothetical protein BDN67DRAFT_1015363 [Paxillus ammoniavirescens]|nr:hypothetical protein BDN67DRAFT_1015363 [Paxillus ammoniavirescens]